MCDNIVSIPIKLNVIIGSRCYRAVIKVEARITKPVEVMITQEEKERAKRNLQGSPMLYQSRDAGEPISETMKIKSTDLTGSKSTAGDRPVSGSY